MTAGELLAIIRDDYLDDGVGTQNWTDEFILREIGRAQQQACYRQDLRHLFDDSFTLTITEGQRSYPLDPLILRLDVVLFDGSPIEHTTRARLDTFTPGWRNYASGPPARFYIQGKTLYLDRVPGVNEDGLTLSLSGWREPDIEPADLTESDDLEWTNDPEKLAHWVAFRAFMRRDEDTQDKEVAKMHLDLFSVAFGAEVPAQARSELLTNPDTIGVQPMRSRPFLSDDTW